ncbi:MAG: hypothetical protein V9H69_05085 [Anaerolineae bacterium]
MQTLQTDESGAAAIAQVTLLGGAQVAPGASQRMVFDLQPGSHIALDFGEGPGAGPPQVIGFEVKASDGPAPAEPAAMVNAGMKDFQFTLPDQIKAGAQTWKIENTGGQWHEMAIFKLNEGVTVDDLMAMMMSGEDARRAAALRADGLLGADERRPACLDGRGPAGGHLHRLVLPARLRLRPAHVASGARHGADVDGDGVALLSEDWQCFRGLPVLPVP